MDAPLPADSRPHPYARAGTVHQWLPFTPNRDFQRQPRVVVGASGMHFTTSNGRSILDGVSSLWCVNAGHRCASINAAIREQLDTLDYSTAFSMTNDRAVQAAGMIAALAPDMLNFAKGVTNGSIPMGGVVCSDRIYDTLMAVDQPAHAIEFFHGYTYSGHPVAAAAVATLQHYVEADLFARAARMAPVLGDAMHSQLRELPNVTGIRTLGMAGAVDLQGMAGNPGRRAYEIFLRCYENGVLVRNAGDVVVLAPAFVAEEAHIAQMVETLAEAIRALA